MLKDDDIYDDKDEQDHDHDNNGPYSQMMMAMRKIEE